MRPVSFVAFAERVLGVRLTLGQRTLARVAFDGVDPAELTPEERALAERILGPAIAIPSSARLVLGIVKGARIGGSYVFGALYSLWRALTADLSTLAPGEQAVALVVAPDLRLARQVLRYAIGAADRVPSIAQLVGGRTADSFALTRPDGARVVIECLPATRGGSAVRGRSLVSAVLSESAYFRDESASVNDLDLFRAVVPRVLPGGMTVLESTPWAEAGLLFDLFTTNFGKPRTAIAARCPTLDMRDDARTRLVVEAETARDPVNARREFGAEFASNSQALFGGDDVDAAACLSDDVPRVQGVRYGCAVDLATRSDLAVCLIGHRELHTRSGQPPADVVVVDVARGWKPTKSQRLDVDELEREVAALANAYRCGQVAGDGWGADFFASRLRARGLTFEEQTMAPSAQSHRAGTLAALFRQRRLRLPNDPEFVRELKAFRVTRSPGGGMRFAAPDRRGQHDDYCKALMLLAERVLTLPVGGGDIVRRIVDGRATYTTPEGAPALPPLGSVAWIRLCHECRSNGTSIKEVDAWLAEPANSEAVAAWAERGQARAFTSPINVR